MIRHAHDTTRQSTFDGGDTFAPHEYELRTHLCDVNILVFLQQFNCSLHRAPADLHSDRIIMASGINQPLLLAAQAEGYSQRRPGGGRINSHTGS